MRLSAFCALCTVFCVFLRRDAPTMAQLLALCVGVFTLFIVLKAAYPYITFFREMANESGFSPYVGMLIKVCGIGTVTRFAAAFCRDAGENTLADKAELCGKCAVLLCTLPILQSVFQQIKDLSQ